ncbi:MAG: sigma-70 family RNA polymerase sigma factor [Candidatus Methylacidiphilales bacterium]|nr:sigma-70 family RNA polymerase sigma factor [Candidatus Methylacidiphilales bacterium]
MVENETHWVEALDPSSASHPDAVAELRSIVLQGLRIALRDRKDVSEAQLEDFTQEALLRILDRRLQFSGRSKFTTWAHTIAINTAFTELRRKRWQDVSLDSLTEEGRQMHEPAVMPDHLLGLEDEKIRLLRVLRQAVEHKLSPKQRAAIMGELQGLPFDQIVSLLGTNRNAAYKMLHDARRALKLHLENEGLSSELIRTVFAT